MGFILSISVQEALTLPVMKEAKIRGGAGGIDNQIKWVTIVEIIEDINRFQEGEFLITTGYGLNDDSANFQRLLAMKQLSGVAIYSGFYLRDIPQTFIDIANQYQLPLIELPTHINFSSITKSILQQILNKQMEVTSFSLETHKQLTNLVLKNEQENKISTTLADLINSSIFVLNEFDEFAYYAYKHHSLLYSDNALFINNRSIPFAPLVKKCRSQRQPSELEWEILKIYVHPIIANEHYHGTLIAITEIEKWQDVYITTIEHAATVYAIEFLKEEAVKQTQIRLQGEFLEEIINGSFQSTSLIIERGKKLGYDLSLYHAVLQIKLEKYEENEIFKQHAEQLYNHVLTYMDRSNRQFMLRTRLDGLIILTEVKVDKKEGNATEDSISLAKNLLHHWQQRNQGIPITIGVGSAYKNVNQLSDSANEAKYAVDLSNLLLVKKEIIHYNDLATFHLLVQMKELGISLAEFYEEQIGKLLEGSKHGIDYIHTLELYFKHNLNIQATAAELFIHRHTLKYRLRQIESRSGSDLNSADARLTLQLAIAAYKLEQYFNS